MNASGGKKLADAMVDELCASKEIASLLTGRDRRAVAAAHGQAL
jgi:hypothetical protein